MSLQDQDDLLQLLASRRQALRGLELAKRRTSHNQAYWIALGKGRKWPTRGHDADGVHRARCGRHPAQGDLNMLLAII